MLTPYGILVMNDGTEVLLEIEAPRRRQLSEKGVVQDLKERFCSIMNLVGETAKSAHEGYSSIPTEIRPKEFELSFGIKINAEAGVVFSKVGSEGSFQVTLRWN